jgi:hypothetical protein
VVAMPKPTEIKVKVPIEIKVREEQPIVPVNTERRFVLVMKKSIREIQAEVVSSTDAPMGAEMHIQQDVDVCERECLRLGLPAGSRRRCRIRR